MRQIAGMPTPLSQDDLDSFERHRGVLWVTAILAILGGILAILMPYVASFAANFGIGFLLAAVGLVQFAVGFRARGFARLAAAVGVGALTAITGFVLLVFPVAGIVALASVLTAYFLVSGALKIWFALKLRPALNWGWMLAGGAAALLLGLLLLTGLPGNAFWVLGLFLGLDLLFYGIAVIGLLIGSRIDEQSEHHRPLETPR